MVPLTVFAITKRLKEWASLQVLKAFLAGLSKCLPEKFQSCERVHFQVQTWQAPDHPP